MVWGTRRHVSFVVPFEKICEGEGERRKKKRVKRRGQK
jgi:hypothetical protein